ncbi:MAG: DUF4175 domain-containing protein [Planctomycetaceae bacterium]|nr:DUF4175 domain-containing protein [Planctomycetaceae bacterium]
MPHPLIQNDLLKKFSSLRRMLRGRLAAEGLAWLVLAAVAAVFVTMGVDFLLRPPERPLRAVFMLMALAGVGVVGWRRLVAPLRVPMSTEDLALLIERSHAQLGDRLISAVQFAASGVAPGASAEMVQVVAAQAHAMAARIDFAPVVERANLRRVGTAAAAAAALLLGFAFWNGDALSRWFQRNVLLADVDWPQRTYLTVRDETMKPLGDEVLVVRGEDLAINVTADLDSESPSSVMVYAKYPSVGDTEARIDPNPEDRRRFVQTFRSVTEEFAFYVTGGDDRRDQRRKHVIRLVDPPAIRSLTFTITPPAYAKAAASDVSGAAASLSVPIGATVQVAAMATKDLQSAQIILEGPGARRVSDMVISKVPAASGGPQAPRGVSGHFTLPQENRPVVLTLQLALKDTAGYVNRRGGTYVVEVRPDTAPVVEARKLVVGPAVTAEAMIPLAINARDDHGLSKLQALTSVAKRKEPLPAQDVAELVVGERSRRVQHVVDLRSFKLAADDTITLHVEAQDTLPASMGGPGIGRSAPFELRIVRPEVLKAELVGRQKALRLEFLQAIGLQSDAQAKTLTVATALADETLPALGAQRLASAAGIETSVSGDCARTAEGFAAILEELACNRLAGEADQKRIGEAIVAPLRKVVVRLRETSAALTQVSTSPPPSGLRAKVTELAAVQDAIRREMETIAEAMEKEATRQELANEVGIIIEESKKLLKLINREGESEAEPIFDPTTQPAKRE